MDPATGEVTARYAATDAAALPSLLAAARDAQRRWTAQSIRERRALLERVRATLFTHRHALAAAISAETGKPVAEAMAAEVVIAMDHARFYRRRLRGFLRPRVEWPSQPALWRKRVEERREPWGVIGIIAPWNYPLMLTLGGVLPAIACGNAVIIKPSEYTPSIGAWITRLLDDAGCPPGLVTVIQGDGRVGAALTECGVDKIIFTGSEATGRKVAQKCAAQLVPCALELGGSDPALVLDDADLDTAASGILWARFTNAGQTCVAPKRVFVAASRYDAFLERFQARVETLRVGSTPESDVGPVIRPVAAALLAAQRDDALARGARIAATAAIPQGSAGHWFAPTVLVDVPPDARVLREETFGPLVVVSAVRDDAEAIARANDSSFGLSASVWSRDAARARRVAAALDAGTVAINDAAFVAGMAEVAHGGVKASGLGRAHGIAGLEESVRTKVVASDRFSAWRQGWWFGYGAAHAAQIDDYVTFTHAPSWSARLRAIGGVLKLLFAPSRPL